MDSPGSSEDASPRRESAGGAVTGVPGPDRGATWHPWLFRTAAVAVLAAFLATGSGPPRMRLEVRGNQLAIEVSGVPEGTRPVVLRDGVEQEVDRAGGARSRWLLDGLPEQPGAGVRVEIGGRVVALPRVVAEGAFARVVGPAAGRNLEFEVARPSTVFWEGAPEHRWFLATGRAVLPAPPRGRGSWRLVREEDGLRQILDLDQARLERTWADDVVAVNHPARELPGGVMPEAGLARLLVPEGPLDRYLAWEVDLLARIEEPRVYRRVWNRFHFWRTLRRVAGLDPGRDPAEGPRSERRRGFERRADAIACPVSAEPPFQFGLIDIMVQEGEFLLPGGKGPPTYLRWPLSLPGGGDWLRMGIRLADHRPRIWYQLAELEVGGRGFRVDFAPAPVAAQEQGEWLVWWVPEAVAPPPGTWVVLHAGSEDPAYPPEPVSAVEAWVDRVER